MPRALELLGGEDDPHSVTMPCRASGLEFQIRKSNFLKGDSVLNIAEVALGKAIGEYFVYKNWGNLGNPDWVEEIGRNGRKRRGP